jgi:hypothetical protein
MTLEGLILSFLGSQKVCFTTEDNSCFGKSLFDFEGKSLFHVEGSFLLRGRIAHQPPIHHEGFAAGKISNIHSCKFIFKSPSFKEQTKSFPVLVF